MADSAAGIAVIGDLHSAWGEEDVRHFNDSDYGLLLFTGDLGALVRHDGVRIAKSISRIERNVLVMPGNNDVAQYGTLAAELSYRRGAQALLRAARGGKAPGNSTEACMCGYSSHTFAVGPHGVTVIAGRPFSFGGPELSFAAELAREFNIHSLEQSAQRIAALAEQAPTRDLIFLSHNGPHGLGDEAISLWGRDFELPSCDWGDPDLTLALAEVQRGSHRVLAVIGGHMHSHTRGGAERSWQLRRDGTLYLNPARVPRVVTDANGDTLRHHVALAWSGEELTASERIVHAASEG